MKTLWRWFTRRRTGRIPAEVPNVGSDKLLARPGWRTVAKLNEPDDSNADFSCVDEERGVYVILDGASQSFDPKRWARVVGEHLIDGSVLGEVVELCAAIFDADSPTDVAWWQEAHVEVGGHCTFLRATLKRGGTIRSLSCEAVGDCVILVVRKTGVYETWPFQSVSEMPRRPATVGSKPPYIRNGQVVRADLEFVGGDRIFMMTDALGRFVVERCNSSQPIEEWWPLMTAEFSDAEFRAWVASLKLQGTLEDDDITVGELLLS